MAELDPLDQYTAEEALKVACESVADTNFITDAQLAKLINIPGDLSGYAQVTSLTQAAYDALGSYANQFYVATDTGQLYYGTILVGGGGVLDGTLVSVDDIGNEAQLFIPTAAADGELVSFAGYSTDYLGTNLTVAAVEAGVVCVDRISVPGTATDGNTLTATPGIWFRPGDPIAAPTYVQKLDGTPISGGTGLTWDVVQTGSVQQFTIEETYGGVTVPSLQTEIPATIAAAYPAYVGSGVSGNTTLDTNETFTVDMTNNNNSQDVILALGAWGTNTITSITLNGVASTAISMPGANNSVLIGYARFPAGNYPASSTVVAISDVGTWDMGAVAYNIPPIASIALIAIDQAGGQLSAVVTGEVFDGDGILGVSMSRDSGNATWTGLTKDAGLDARSGEWITAASAQGVTAEAARVMSAENGFSSIIGAASFRIFL